VAALVCKRLLDAEEPIAGLVWEVCRPVLRVFCKSGRKLLIELLDADVRELSHTAALHGAEQVEFSPCGRYAAIMRGGQLAVWNFQKDRIVPSPPGVGVLERMAWRPNSGDCHGELWLAGSFGLAVWSADGDFHFRCREFSTETAYLAWDPTGTYLARACKGGALLMWNAHTNELARLDWAGEFPVRELAWNSNGLILAGASGSSFFTWSVPAAFHGDTHARFVRRIDAPVSRLAFRPRSSILAVGRIDGVLELLRTAGTGEAPRFAQFAAAVSHLAWSAHGKELAVGTSQGQVHAMRVCK
jgi:WD40 repeat protein